MTLNEKLTLIALVAGPVFAVVITIWSERRRSVRERRLVPIRTLIATRHMPSDGQYNIAINLVPVEFNDCPDVMKAWEIYHREVNTPAGNDPAGHDTRMRVALSALIFQMSRTVGLKMSEGDIQIGAYISQGFVNRDNLYLDSLRATIEIAGSLKEQTALLRAGGG